MAERAGIVFMKGNPLTLTGEERKVGDLAPDCELLDISLAPVKLSSFRGRTCFLSTVPSLDTSVCHLETIRFNKEAEKLDKTIAFLTVSMDLPFAQKRWCEETKSKNVVLLSDHRNGELGLAYGVMIKELRLLARTIFIIDKQGKIRYIQYVKETSEEPDYDAALQALADIK